MTTENMTQKRNTVRSVRDLPGHSLILSFLSQVSPKTWLCDTILNFSTYIVITRLESSLVWCCLTTYSTVCLGGEMALFLCNGSFKWCEFLLKHVALSHASRGQKIQAIYGNYFWGVSNFAWFKTIKFLYFLSFYIKIMRYCVTTTLHASGKNENSVIYVSACDVCVKMR